MIKVTAVSKALTGPCDQIIRSRSRHFGHYVKVKMLATFLIGPSMVDVCCNWFVRGGYITFTRIKNYFKYINQQFYF